MLDSTPWEPSQEDLDSLNRTRWQHGMEPLEDGQIRTIGEWRMRCNEVDAIAETRSATNKATAQKPEDGGPAFPLDSVVSERHYGHSDAYHGMTLRDYFAANSMNASMVNIWGLGAEPKPEARREWLRLQATLCYEAADAMLEARNK